MTKGKEFEENKKLIEMQKVADLEKHEMKMKQLEFFRESNRIFHERELERGRIKWAEMRKNQMRKQGHDPYKH